MGCGEGARTGQKIGKFTRSDEWRGKEGRAGQTTERLEDQMGGMRREGSEVRRTER